MADTSSGTGIAESGTADSEIVIASETTESETENLSVSGTTSTSSGYPESKTPSGTSTTPSRSSSLSVPSNGGKKRTASSVPQSVRQQMKTAKLNVCASSEISSTYRVKEQRLKVLRLMMQARRELGDPFDKSELPEDLYDLLYNSKDKL